LVPPQEGNQLSDEALLPVQRPRDPQAAGLAHEL